MAKCAKCKQKKAKRFCTALGAELCSRCCGLLRNKEIHCPPSCSFFIQHKPYQEKKIIEKKRPAPSKSELGKKDILHDERMAWLVLHIEAPIKEYGERNLSLTDKDVLLALDYARERMEKCRQLIILPGGDQNPKNDLGEAILKSMESCRYQREFILAAENQTYKNEEKLRCLDRVIRRVKSWAKDDFESRNYIQYLSDLFAKIKESSLQRKIISST